MAVPFANLASTTIENQLSVLRDNILTDRALFLYLFAGKDAWMPAPGPMGVDRMTPAIYKKPQPHLARGGENIEFAISYATTTNVGSYSGAEALSYGVQEQITKGQVPWTSSYADITISDDDVVDNSDSTHRAVNLVEAKLAIAKESLIAELATQIFSDGTGNSSKDIDGLRAAIGVGTYAGIAGGTDTWWQSNITDMTGESSTKITWDYVDQLIVDCTIGNDEPTLCVTTKTLWQALKKRFQPHMRFSGPEHHDVMRAYNWSHMLSGNVPVVYDAQCPSGYFFCLNNKYLHMVTNSQRNLIQERIAKPHDANIWNWKIWYRGNLICTERRKQGALTGATA